MATEVDLGNPTTEEIMTTLEDVAEREDRRKFWQPKIGELAFVAASVGGLGVAFSEVGPNSRFWAVFSAASFIVTNFAYLVYDSISEPDPAVQVFEKLETQVGFYRQSPMNGEGVG